MNMTLSTGIISILFIVTIGIIIYKNVLRENFRSIEHIPTVDGILSKRGFNFVNNENDIYSKLWW